MIRYWLPSAMDKFDTVQVSCDDGTADDIEELSMQVAVEAGRDYVTEDDVQVAINRTLGFTPTAGKVA